MELEDCAFPTLQGLVVTDQPAVAFKNTDYALLVGAKPRGPGMERADLLRDNAKIFTVQGKALNEHANRQVKVLVVGNPANTNALIAQSNAPDLNPTHFTAMTRLDHNRARAKLASHLGSHVTGIKRMTIWGNHSATQYPDLSHALVNEQQASALVTPAWVKEEFISTVQQRGAAIIKARGCPAPRQLPRQPSTTCVIGRWARGEDWVSMGIPADGSYGIAPGIIFSYPVRCNKGTYEIVKGLSISDFSRGYIALTETELRQEREAVAALL